MKIQIIKYIIIGGCLLELCGCDKSNKLQNIEYTSRKFNNHSTYAIWVSYSSIKKTNKFVTHTEITAISQPFESGANNDQTETWAISSLGEVTNDKQLETSEIINNKIHNNYYHTKKKRSYYNISHTCVPGKDGYPCGTWFAHFMAQGNVSFMMPEIVPSILDLTLSFSCKEGTCIIDRCQLGPDYQLFKDQDKEVEVKDGEPLISFYYSQKAADNYRSLNQYMGEGLPILKNYAKIGGGNIVLYTEACSPGQHPKYKDGIFLGFGYIDHTEGEW